MAVFYLTQAAKSDLKEIGRYTQREWGTAQRNKYLAMLDESFHMLAVHPFIRSGEQSAMTSGRDTANTERGATSFFTGRFRPPSR